MTEEKLLTVRDVSLFLNITEKEVLDLAESSQLPAYKVAGVYLRFKKEQVEEFRKNNKTLITPTHASGDYSWGERVSDFFYFNDFYILSILIILLILVIIFQG